MTGTVHDPAEVEGYIEQTKDLIAAAVLIIDEAETVDADNRRSIATTTLKRLRRRGLAVTAGQVPRQGRGGRAYIWVLTD